MFVCPKYIQEFDWSEFLRIEDEDISKLLNDPNFRIIKIVNNSLNTNDLTNNSEKVINLLRNSSHLFLLSIVSDSDLDLNEFDNVLVDIFKESKKTHFLIEFCSPKIVRFILNEGKVKKVLTEELKETDEEENEQKLSLINSLIIQSGDQSLVSLVLSEYQRFIDCDLYQIDAIGVRLLKTFDNEEQVDEECDKSILKTLVTQPNVHVVRAYFNLSIADDGNLIYPTELAVNVNTYKYNNEQTLLSIAANGDLDILKLLLRLGADIQAEDKYKKTASDYACNNLENLKFLLENDARFPRQQYQPFESASGTGIKEEILTICQQRDEFHKSIEDGDEEKIQEFRKKYPGLKFAYKLIDNYPCSRAATTTALLQAQKDEKYETYFLLLDEGFRSNDFEMAEVQLKKPMKSKVNVLWLSHLRRKQSQHICRFLLSMTKIAYVSVEEHEKYFQKIKEIYQSLNTFDEMKSLLKILEYSKSLIINFDFFNKSVVAMDLHAEDHFDGNTYHNLGRIYISAAGKTNKVLAGVLMHELTHFALHIVFNNACKPYYKSDKDGELIFKLIVEDFKKAKLNHSEIKKVYRSYAQKNHAKELIVKVPELIVIEEKSILMEKYTELYNFFFSRVLPIVNEVTREPEQFLIKREVEQLNEVLGHVEKIEKWDIWTKENFIPEIWRSSDENAKMIVCNTPRLFLANFYKFIIRPSLISSSDTMDGQNSRKEYFILASLEDFNSPLKLQSIQRIWNLTSDITLLLNSEGFDANLLKKYKFLNKDIPGKILVFGSEEFILRQILTDDRIECFDLPYKWDHIDGPSREKLLSTEISFQGANVKLNNLIDDDFQNIPLEKLINGDRIVIAASKVFIDNYDPQKFVHRRFAKYGNVEQVLLSKNDQVVSLFLSGEAGTGKSIIMSHIALKLKSEQYNQAYWVTRINLHEHVDAFDEDTVDDPFAFVAKYFVKTENNSDQEFEQELFQKLYNLHRVILLLDGLDEIAPHFTGKAISLICGLGQKIQLWITTRPHLHKDLEEKLTNGISLEFDRFTHADQLECATKYWKKELKLSGDVNDRKLKTCGEKIILQFYESIHEVVSWASVVGAPLLITMVAENYLKDVEQNIKNNRNIFETADYIDIFQLFKEFISKKLLITNKEKGILIAKERVHNEIFGDDIIALFERLALKFIFRNDHLRDRTNSYIYNDADFYDKPLMIDINNIQRCGVVSFSSNGEPFFVHRTIAEFFIANFVIKSLKNASSRDRKFNVSMEILCKIIINKTFGLDRFTLIKFINEGMKYLWNEENESETLQAGAMFLNKSESESENENDSHDDSMFDYSSLDNAMNENAHFIVYFFIKCLSRYDREKRVLYDESSHIFWLASEKCVRCIVEYLYDLLDPDDVKSCILHKYKDAFTAFQLTFMNFPQCDMDIIKDTTNFIQQKDSLFTTFEEKYKNSTLKLHVDIANKFLVELEDRKELMLEYDLPFLNYDYNISEKHFEDSIEMKWMAMNELNLNIPCSDFEYLGSKTLFQSVIHIIFNEFNNKIILKFYDWAKVKSQNNSTFKNFVESTFVEYFWNCSSENGVKEILKFVRNEINIKAVLERRSQEIITKILSYDSRFNKNFPICQNNFTYEEFEVLLFHVEHSSEHSSDNFVQQFFKSDPRSSNIDVFLQVISKLLEKDGFLEKMHEFTVNESNNLDIWIRDVVDNRLRLNKTLVCDMMNSIDAIFLPIQLKITLQFVKENKTLFHLAANQRDICMMQVLWHMAKKYLPDELEHLLGRESADNFSIIKNDTSKKFLEEPPSLDNTDCASATYEFIPFRWGDIIPENAVAVNVEETVYIGQATSDGELCEIETTKMQVNTIGYNGDDGEERPDDEFEILVGRGLSWELKDDVEYRPDEHYFTCNRHFLSRNVSLDEVHNMGEYYLVYDDDLCNIEYNTNSERNFIYHKK